MHCTWGSGHYIFVCLVSLFTLGVVVSWTLPLADTFPVFIIKSKRYADYACATEPLGDETKIVAGLCWSWYDEGSFRSFKNGWVVRKQSTKESPGKYGACELRLWAGDDCMGEYLGEIYGPNSYDTLGYCLTADQGQSIRSMMVVCSRTGVVGISRQTREQEKRS